LAQEPNKKIIYSPSKNLQKMSQLMTPKYFANIFYKQYLPIVRYNTNEILNVKKYMGIDSKPMESNYFFNLSKNRMAANFFIKEKIPNKNWNNFILPEIYKTLSKKLIQGCPDNILDVSLIIVGDPVVLPTQFFKNDIFICALKGTADIEHAEPTVINELDPYICFPFTRKRIGDIETKSGKNQLREGDFMYIPNGTVIDISFKNYEATQIIFIIEFDNFQKEGRDPEIDIIKLEQIQLCKIPRKIYPKDLQPDELDILWQKKIINGNNWEKNALIKNPLF
jgi:hypothetical protein